MASDTVRVGIVGAGKNTRARHLPHLQSIEGVEVLAVCNRRPESTAAVAGEFGIPRTCADWRELIAMQDLDAIVIGTWPYLHCEITCAAFEAGKHVLCEARMAMDATEAHLMLDAQRRCGLVGQVVPSPVGLRGHRVMLDMITEGFLGRPYEVSVRAMNAAYLDPGDPLSWRQDERLSGLNVLTLGIYNETVQRWLGETVMVQASERRFVPRRIDPETGEQRTVGCPDSIAVLADMACGARAVYHLSGVARAADEPRIEIYGSQGTIIYLAGSDRILAAEGQKSELVEVPIPPEQAGKWTVEQDFIASIREGTSVTMTSFEDGVRYMEFTAAVHSAASEGCSVCLPIRTP